MFLELFQVVLHKDKVAIFPINIGVVFLLIMFTVNSKCSK